MRSPEDVNPRAFLLLYDDFDTKTNIFRITAKQFISFLQKCFEIRK